MKMETCHHWQNTTVAAAVKTSDSFFDDDDYILFIIIHPVSRANVQSDSLATLKKCNVM